MPQAQTIAEPESAFTPRQGDVLACALDLLVAGGEKALTTAGLARAANCSKESLYKWFGDRDGLLAAVITFQAAKVRTPGADTRAPSAEAYRERLEAFAQNLLEVLSGDVSLALNRLAIGQASSTEAPLGRLLIERGKRTVNARGQTLLETGRRFGYLAFDDPTDAYRTFYGLIVRDVHLRLMLGERLDGADADFAAQAKQAVKKFYRLFGP
ncbi:TetR/AcrR family transcriptional regulator [Breoghania sp. L-A4]|uniref:TetR/AcrR family transcriptional regulator n=1 Tax=Breoghania sp. L-A4 TaxID=2304600 RepID=UPI000E35E1A4|nr:TetR/AcrR family transcriptional regulator [Breoghania sp. L-A4]AXS41290.1 TetR/AcrR family transcriptional regulator [Breoghania sp. L-A4]